jgi:hypothetical protein
MLSLILVEQAEPEPLAQAYYLARRGLNAAVLPERIGSSESCGQHFSTRRFADERLG